MVLKMKSNVLASLSSPLQGLHSHNDLPPILNASPHFSSVMSKTVTSAPEIDQILHGHVSQTAITRYGNLLSLLHIAETDGRPCRNSGAKQRCDTLHVRIFRNGQNEMLIHNILSECPPCESSPP